MLIAFLNNFHKNFVIEVLLSYVTNEETEV